MLSRPYPNTTPSTGQETAAPIPESRLNSVDRALYGVLSRSPVDRELPLASFGQQRSWFLNQLDPANGSGNLVRAVRLNGSINADQLTRALDAIVARHAILRTTFVPTEGVLRQRIAAMRSTEMPVLDYSGQPRAQQEESIVQAARAEIDQPFDLAAGPLLRARLLILGLDHYVLILASHEIVCDEQSLDLILEELSETYGGNDLGQVAVQYTQLALRQRARLNGALLERLLGFWRDQLEEELPNLDLPTVAPRPSVQTFHSKRQPIDLNEELVTKLHALAQTNELPPGILILAAYVTVLHRHTHQSTITIGLPDEGRSALDAARAIGPLMNILVLRVDVKDELSFIDLARQIYKTQCILRAHDEMPFARLLDELEIKRDLGRMPLYQAMFHLQDQTPSLPCIGEATAQAIDIDTGVTNVDVSLRLRSNGQTITGWLQYNSDLFDPAAMQRLAGHIINVLQDVVRNPNQSIATIPILSDAERRQMLEDWNQTARPIPNACFHELFARVAETNSNSLAVTCGDQSLTFQQLNDRADQLARHLRSLGAGPDKLIGVCMHRSPELMIALLGILRSGAAYLPFDPEYPPQRLAFMLHDAGVEILLTQTELRENLPADTIKIVEVNADHTDLAPREPNDGPSTTPDNLAYVIYTSGSTGQPKGAQITHRGLVNYLLWAIDAYRIADAGGRGAPVHSSLAFDLTITALLAPLLAGKPVAFIPYGSGIDALAQSLEDSGPFNLVKITPAHLEILARQLSPEQAAGRTNAFIIGGEALPAETVAFWREHAPQTRLINEYGPTETVVGCCVYEVPCTGSIPRNIPIGRPIANTRLYILDAHLQPVPIGVIGELYIAGAGVARGYLNQPRLTAERFLPDPFGPTGTRMYRTGDRARYLPDGNIEFLGRVDHQVKIRGYRIEPAEIEAALVDLPCIRDAVVIVREDIPGMKRLVAYVTAAPGQSCDVRAVLESLSTRLPDYMIPSGVVVVSELPLTPNGKVDRSALPSPEIDPTGPRHDDAAYAHPRDDIERALIDIWQRVLGLRSIGIRDNFFALGGHSLGAVAVAVSIQKELGRMMPLATLFQYPTIEQLAANLREVPAAASGLSPMVVIQRGSEQVAPLFCLPGAGGHCVNFRAMAQHLDADRGVIGFNLRGLDGRGKPHTRVEDMAVEFLELARGVRPHGPYHLVGYSFGGWVALEMARLLRQQGEEVGALILVDSWGKNYPQVFHASHRLRVHAHNLLHLRFDEKIRYVRGRLQNVRRRGSHFWQRFRRDYLRVKPSTMPAVIEDVKEATWRAMQGYVPQPYSGPVTLFRADVTPSWPGSSFADPLNGWGEVITGGLEVEHFDCRHLQMFEEPFVAELAAKVELRLRESQLRA